MNKELNYFKQCELTKKEGKLTTHQTAWIPERLAHVGKVVKLHIQGDIWDDHWEVTSVGVRQSEEYVMQHERDYITQPKASDAVRDQDGRWKKLGE